MNPEVYRQSIELLSEVVDPGAVADELLAIGAAGRAAERAVVAALEHRPEPSVIAVLIERSALEGEGTGSIRRLVRRARGREEGAMRRSNPVSRREGFVCMHCGQQVSSPRGGMQRNHCPACLHSRHVDDVPGDRASRCGGLMEPVAVEQMGVDGAVIRHRCVVCGAQRRNRTALDAEVQPDSQRALRELAAREPRR